VLRSIFIFFAQILGAIAAAGLVRGLIPGDGVKFGVSLRPGTTIVQGLFLEMFLTCELVFTILMLAAEKTKATFVAPVGIGLALFVAELVGVFWTGGALNPCRAFGPNVVMGSFNSDHWIYCTCRSSFRLASSQLTSIQGLGQSSVLSSLLHFTSFSSISITKK